MSINKMDWVIDCVGANDWNEVVEEFGNCNASSIEPFLDTVFPSDHNAELAETIIELLGLS